MKIVLSTLNAKYIHSSLALRYLKNFCQPLADVVVKEYSINNSLLAILADIYREQPGVIGFACYIWNIDMTMDLTRLLKKVCPQTVIILGGPEVSYDPAETLSACDSIDYIIQGEGEEILSNLVQALTTGADLKNIAGLAYRQDGVIKVNGGPQLISSLDDIGFPYSDEDMHSLKDKIIYYESSRGCPFSCQYCLSSATQGVRFLSLERVFADMEFFIRHNVKQVKFVDRTFNARKDHYFPLLKFLANKQCHTNFHFEIAADILDDDVIEFLQSVPEGRFQFEIGVQSTYEPTLAEIHRHNNWPRIVDVVTRLRRADNIHLHLDLIVGLPYERLEQFGQSFNDLYALKPHMLQIGFLKLLKGSGIRRQVAEHGYVFMDTAPYEVLSNRYLSYAEVRRLQILEDVFSQIYNSGRFSAAINWLVNQYSDAFTFYQQLASFWEDGDLHTVSHSTKTTYQNLAEFARLNLSDGYKLLLEFLKFDALMSDRGSVRPDFLPWNGETFNDDTTRFWRDEKRVHKYLPEYRFTTWRDLKKSYHIEVFNFNLSAYWAEGRFEANQTAILFVYGQDKVRYQLVTADDFFG